MPDYHLEPHQRLWILLWIWDFSFSTLIHLQRKHVFILSEQVNGWRLMGKDANFVNFKLNLQHKTAKRLKTFQRDYMCCVKWNTCLCSLVPFCALHHKDYHLSSLTCSSGETLLNLMFSGLMWLVALQLRNTLGKWLKISLKQIKHQLSVK